jgi:hypothetical protein
VDSSVIFIIVVAIAICAVGYSLRHFIFRMTHTPAEICERYGHHADDWMETSGRGRHARCTRCKAAMYEPEWS